MSVQHEARRAPYTRQNERTPSHRRQRPARPRLALPADLPPATRKKVETALERLAIAQAALIGFLDYIDGDTDREDGGDDEPVGDDEPSLASQDGMLDITNQETWSAGNTTDLEEEHDGREHSWTETHGDGGHGSSSGSSEDDEPSLAHTLDLNQATAHRNVDDRNLRMPRGGGEWAYANSDLEQEFDGREDGHDREQENEHGVDGARSVDATVDDEPRCPPRLDLSRAEMASAQAKGRRAALPTEPCAGRI